MEELMKMQLIVLMRIYDVLMTDMTERKPEIAKKLYMEHDAGRLMSPAPWSG